tara:strand:+ start:296 stop:634 length:339 start_codon:yes stop_codon:yes gene_type:complete
MAYTHVADLEDLWEGEMLPIEIDGKAILLLYPRSGDITAIQGHCPHQQILLADGDFDGDRRLTCSAHRWQFDVVACKGINPDNTLLANYPAKVENNKIYIDADGVEPNYSGI